MNDWWIEAGLARAKEILSALLVVGGVLWFVAKPMVDAYIEDAIAGQSYATQDSVVNLNSKILKSGQTIGEVRDQQIRQQEQLKSIEKNTQEMRSLLFQLLQKQSKPN